MSQFDPLGTLSSSLTKGTTSLHEIMLPCASLWRATTHAWRAPSTVTTTPGFAAAGADTGVGALVDDPQPVSAMHTAVRTVILPSPLMAAWCREPIDMAGISNRSIGLL
jgi:hypothetical protein